MSLSTDLLIESLALWLVWSGVAWLALAAYRFRTHGLDVGNAGLLAAAFAGWAALLRLTTGVFGSPEVIHLGLVPLVKSGLPVYLTVVVLLPMAGAVGLLSGRSRVATVAALAALVAGPALALPALVGEAGEVALFSDPMPVTVAQLPPRTPITDAAHPGMVYVPAGPFIMGTLHPAQLRDIVGNLDGDEQPVRSVLLDGFYIDQYEVTNDEFARFVERTGHVTGAETKGTGQVWGADGWFSQDGADWRHPKGPGDDIEGRGRHPVVQVTWDDANAFCAWENKRLPTEAEWEKAGRGVDARDYPWGSTFDATKVNFCDAECVQLPRHRDPSASDGYAGTAPVGSFPGGVSPYGLYDMVGNVWEWVHDWYDADYYKHAPNVNPPGPDHSSGIGASEHRVVRGGSWTSQKDFTRVTSRSYDPPTWSYFGVGFRCASDH